MRSWEAEGGEWSDEAFDGFARGAFQLQCDGNEAYRRYCERRGVTPAGVTTWTDIPPVPVAAFRHVPLIVGGEGAAQLEFLTSGTTAGPANRGRHLVRDPGLYRASMEAAFLRLALGDAHTRTTSPDGARRPRLYGSFLEPFAQSRGSSLAWMIDGLMRRFGGHDSRHFASTSGVDWEAAGDFVAGAVAGSDPVCIFATTLALDAWVRRMREEGRRWQLPAGSVLMDTGGAKGRTGLSRTEVCRGATERLGIDAARIVNEFGMTELLSQLYAVPEKSGSEPDSPDGLEHESPWLRGPPWLRVRCLDPNDLGSLPDGDPGLLCYFDLANLGSACGVLTEDVGRVCGGSVQWLRRFPGAPPRGCSLATAELLAANENRSGG